MSSHLFIEKVLYFSIRKRKFNISSFQFFFESEDGSLITKEIKYLRVISVYHELGGVCIILIIIRHVLKIVIGSISFFFYFPVF